MKVYEFCYSDCIYESAAATISLHFSEEGATKAMNEHKQKERIEHDEMYKDEGDHDFAFDSMKSWFVREVEILP